MLKVLQVPAEYTELQVLAVYQDLKVHKVYKVHAEFTELQDHAVLKEIKESLDRAVYQEL